MVSDCKGGRVWALSVWSLHIPPVSVWVLFGYFTFFPQSKNTRETNRGLQFYSLTAGVTCVCFLLLLFFYATLQ